MACKADQQWEGLDEMAYAEKRDIGRISVCDGAPSVVGVVGGKSHERSITMVGVADRRGA